MSIALLDSDDFIAAKAADAHTGSRIKLRNGSMAAINVEGLLHLASCRSAIAFMTISYGYSFSEVTVGHAGLNQEGRLDKYPYIRRPGDTYPDCEKTMWQNFPSIWTQKLAWVGKLYFRPYAGVCNLPTSKH